jgi:hypothetical protein
MIFEISCSHVLRVVTTTGFVSLSFALFTLECSSSLWSPEIGFYPATHILLLPLNVDCIALSSRVFYPLCGGGDFFLLVHKVLTQSVPLDFKI